MNERALMKGTGRWAGVALVLLILAACGGAPPAAPEARAPVVPPSAPASDLAEGVLAPDFDLPADDGTRVVLSSHRGKRPVILYFYPKDNTPGCTKQACSYRDAADSIAARGAVVYGISVDDTASHAGFREEHQLNFPLLADVGGVVAAQYGVLNESGRARRVTFVIATDGTIRKILRDVDPVTDPERALEAL